MTHYLWNAEHTVCIASSHVSAWTLRVTKGMWWVTACMDNGYEWNLASFTSEASAVEKLRKLIALISGVEESDALA